jgi:hypothetical protein
MEFGEFHSSAEFDDPASAAKNAAFLVPAAFLAALGPVLGPSKFSGIQLNFSAEFR